MPGTRPTLLPSTEASAWVAFVVEDGSSSGSSVSAVSVLSVLAGRKRRCGAFAASTAPVSASATSQEPMSSPAGSAGAPGPGETTTSSVPSRGPPTASRGAAGVADAAGAPISRQAAANEATREERISTGRLPARSALMRANARCLAGSGSAGADEGGDRRGYREDHQAQARPGHGSCQQGRDVGRADRDGLPAGVGVEDGDVVGGRQHHGRGGVDRDRSQHPPNRVRIGTAGRIFVQQP